MAHLSLSRARIRHWWQTLTHIDVPDRFQCRLYPLLIATIAALGGLDLLGLLVSLARMAGGEPAGLTAGLYGGLVALSGAGLWLARRRAFYAAVLLISTGLIVIQALGLLSGGLIYAAIMLPAMLTAIVFSGLLLGWSGGGAITALSVGLAALIGWLEASGLLHTPLGPGVSRSLIFNNVFVHACLALFVLVIVVSFRNALRTELGLTQEHEQALRTARDTLQEQVDERTADLRRALEESERRGGELTLALAALERSEATVRQLEAPIIPVLPGVLLVPVVGQLDSDRLQRFHEEVLAQVVRHKSRVLILDVTSLQLIDVPAARALVDLAASVRLIGAQAILVGIGPEVAQALIALSVSLTIPTFATLEQAVLGFLPSRAASAAVHLEARR